MAAEAKAKTARPRTVAVAMRRACAAAVVVGLALSAGRAAAEPCMPRVRVMGDPALARSVIALLYRRGISVDQASRCGSLTAVLTPSGERTRVTIVDGEGRAVERMAEDVAAATTTIESWARRDLSDPLIAGRPVPPPAPATVPTPTPASSPARARQSIDREVPPHEAPTIVVKRLIEIGAGGEAALWSDDTLWTGARAHACVSVGAACTGVLIRYAVDTESQGRSVERVTERSALNLFFTADVPFRLGRRFSLSPGAAVGMSSLRAKRKSADRERIDRIDLALRAQLAVGCRIAGAWSLRADLALGYSPFGDVLLEEISDDTRDDHDGDEGTPLAGFARLQGSLGLDLVYSGL